MFHVKQSSGWRSTRRCCGNGRRPSTWWRPARWMPSGTAISPIPPRFCALAPPVPAPGSTSAPAPVSLAWWSRSCWRTADRSRPPPLAGRDRWGSRAPCTLTPPRRGRGAVSTRVTLIESDSRKCAFLREVARKTGVTVDILSTRIELAATQAKLDSPEVVSARALAPLDRLLGLGGPLVHACTVGVFLKGRDAAAEVETAAKAWTFDSRDGSQPYRSHRARCRHSRSATQIEGLEP